MFTLMRIALLGIIGCGLVACAKPSSHVPMASKQEILAEQQEQQRLANNAASEDDAAVSYSKAQLDAMHKRLQGIIAKLAPEATKLCREMNGPEANCNMHVEISADGKGLNAYADGTKIVVFPRMVEFATNDAHLALVIAHEYTHHMMQHVASTKQNVMTGALLGTALDLLAASQGIGTNGQFGSIGAEGALMSYSPAFEHEADYIALYMLARAGYNIDDAPNFWRQMAQKNPKGIYTRTTHPTTPERFVTLSKTIAEIKQKQASGGRLLPNMKPDNG